MRFLALLMVLDIVSEIRTSGLSGWLILLAMLVLSGLMQTEQVR